MRKAKLLLASVLIVASFAACTSNEAEGGKTTVTANATSKQVADAEAKVKRVQSTYKGLMAAKIAEVDALKEENAKLNVKLKRTQNTFKAELAKKIKEIEELKEENAKLKTELEK